MEKCRRGEIQIQIQHLLKLNGVGRSLGGENNNSNTTLVKVKYGYFF